MIILINAGDAEHLCKIHKKATKMSTFSKDAAYKTYKNNYLYKPAKNNQKLKLR